MEIRYHNNQVVNFVISLDAKTRSRVHRVLDLLGEYGHRLRMPFSRSLGLGLFELRVRGTQEVRLFYTFHGGGVVCLHGFVKHGRKIPMSEFSIARQRQKELEMT